MKNHLFVDVIVYSLIGALIGIFAGALLGYLIWVLQFPLSWLNSVPAVVQMRAPFWPSALIPESLGMGIGAIIGSIMGGRSALIQFKK